MTPLVDVYAASDTVGDEPSRISRDSEASARAKTADDCPNAKITFRNRGLFADTCNSHPLFTLLSLFLFVLSATANPDTSIIPHSRPGPFFAETVPPRHQFLRIVVGTLVGILLLIGSLVGGAFQTLLEPLMGITSVLWVMMRSDPYVPPALSWLDFGSWSVLFLTYITVQSGRVAHRKLFILLALAFGGICMCIMALIQKAPVQGVLATAIPPCASFAAYAVAFCFPDRRHSRPVLPV